MGWLKKLSRAVKKSAPVLGMVAGTVFTGGIGGAVLGGMAGSALAGAGKVPKIKGVGTNPAAENAAAETAAAQQAMAATSLKRRLRRASMLTAAGSTKSAAAPALSSVFSYGKTMTGE